MFSYFLIVILGNTVLQIHLSYFTNPAIDFFITCNNKEHDQIYFSLQGLNELGWIYFGRISTLVLFQTLSIFHLQFYNNISMITDRQKNTNLKFFFFS